MDGVRIISLLGLAIIGLRICLAAKRERRKPRYQAAERFFEAFFDEIRDLNERKKDTAEIVEQAFPKHEKAYAQFRVYLKGKGLRKFDDAWEGYSRRLLDDPQSRGESYSDAGNGTAPEKQRQLALKELLRFLSSAKKYSHLPPR